MISYDFHFTFRGIVKKEVDDDTMVKIRFEAQGVDALPTKSDYSCPVDADCEVDQDSGLHLLLDHGMVYCHLCDGEFSPSSSGFCAGFFEA